MSQLNERGANSERNSALWGTGGRGGDRSSVLWGKGGRGMLVANDGRRTRGAARCDGIAEYSPCFRCSSHGHACGAGRIEGEQP